MSFRYRALLVLSFCLVFVPRLPAEAQEGGEAGLDAATLAALQQAAAQESRAGMIAAVAQAIAANPDRATNIVAEAVRLAPDYHDAIVAVASAQLPDFAERRAPTPAETDEAEIAAAPALVEVPSPWSGEMSLGGSLATGNAEHSTVAAGGNLRYDSAPWTHELDLSFQFARDNEETSAERLAINGQSNYDIDERTYLFGFVGYLDDRFSGFDYEVTEAVGLGYRLIDSDDVTLSVEAGPGYRFSKRSDTGEVEDELVGRGAIDFAWILSETTKLTNVTAIVQGAERRTLENTTAITADLFGDFDGRLSFNVRHDSDPPLGTEATDTLTKAALVYDF